MAKIDKTTTEVAPRTRVSKTEAQRAAEGVRVQLNRIDKQRAKIEEASAALGEAHEMMPELTSRLVYLAANPDLDPMVLEGLREDGYLPLAGQAS